MEPRIEPEAIPRRIQSFETTIQKLKENIELRRKEYEFGPEFRVTREGRPPINVLTFRHPEHDINFLIGMDDEGNIVGRRYFLRTKVTPTEEVFEGQIYMSDQVHGATNQMEQAFITWLQMRADSSNKKVRYKATNQNRKDKDDFVKKGISANQREALEKEAKRWDALYGENGKLGFKKAFLSKDTFYLDIEPSKLKTGNPQDEIMLYTLEVKNIPSKKRTLSTAEVVDQTKIDDTISFADNDKRYNGLIQLLSGKRMMEMELAVENS